MLRSAPTIITTAIALALLGAPAFAVPLMIDAGVNVNPAMDTSAEIEAKREMFEELDADNDGYLAKSEAEALPSVEEGVYGADDFGKIDNDANGEVDFQEFAIYLNTDDAQIAQFKRIPAGPDTSLNVEENNPEDEGVDEGQ